MAEEGGDAIMDDDVADGATFVIHPKVVAHFGKGKPKRNSWRPSAEDLILNAQTHAPTICSKPLTPEEAAASQPRPRATRATIGKDAVRDCLEGNSIVLDQFEKVAWCLNLYFKTNYSVWELCAETDQRNNLPRRSRIAAIPPTGMMQIKMTVVSEFGLHRNVVNDPFLLRGGGSTTSMSAPPGPCAVVDQKGELSSETLDEESATERALLAKYCKTQIERWKRVLDGNDDTLRLVRYIEPWFSELVRGEAQDASQAAQGDGAKTVGERYRPLSKARRGEDEKFAPLFDLGHRILVHEDAGAGKSVFTRAAVAWLSRDAAPDRLKFLKGQRCLAMRWERDHDPWPSLTENSGAETYFEAIVARFRRDAGCTKTEAEQVVERLWAEGRIVLFLDAFDQLSGAETAKQRDALAYLANSPQRQPADQGPRLVVTSRAHTAVNEPLFKNPGWRKARIEGFSPWQQVLLLQEPLNSALGDSWSGEFEELLATSNTPAGADDQALDKFAVETLRRPEIFGDIHGQVAEMLAVPVVLNFVHGLAIRSPARPSPRKFPEFVNRSDLYWQAIEHQFIEKLPKAQRTVVRNNVDLYLQRYWRILGAAAFHMMVADSQHYETTNLVDLHDNTFGSAKRDRFIENDWELLWEEVGEIAGLTNHQLIEEKSSRRFGFKHKGIMEFFCGLHLAKYAAADEQACLPNHAADPAWFWAFRFAMELTQLPVADGRNYDHDTLPRTLAPLFGPVTQSDRRLPSQPPTDSRQEHHWRRPTQLMFYAYCLLETDAKKLPLGCRDPHFAKAIGDSAGIIRNFHESFRNKLNDPMVVDVAKQLTLEHSYHLAGGDRPKIRSFVSCPPSGRADDPVCTYLMGERVTAKPVRVEPFWMASTPVTVEQFALFEPIYGEVLKEQSGPFRQPTNPAIDCSWYDAFMFAHWVGEGCRLPSEAEWEFACRARLSVDAPYTNFSFGNSCNGSECNCDGNYPYPDETPKRDPPPYVMSTTPSGRYGRNEYGLWDMHGNVWEWCAEWYNDSSRVVRGGSWYNYARNCRSAYRYRFSPVYRYGYLGFRLARTK